MVRSSEEWRVYGEPRSGAIHGLAPRSPASPLASNDPGLDERGIDMRRWMSRVFMGLCGLVLAIVMAGVTYQWLATRSEITATPPPGRLVDIGGYRLHLWCTGDGAPAVILDAGLGGTSTGWGFVQPEVARFTRVCSYDRAGMGYSDPGPSPRTARRVAHELAELLDV